MYCKIIKRDDYKHVSGGNMCVSVVSGLHVTHPFMMFLKRNPLENLVAECSRRVFLTSPWECKNNCRKM